MRTIAALLALSLAASACGARTALDVEPPDAGSFFTTFPCRWSLGLTVELASGAEFGELTGAVHPTLDQAALLASERTGGLRVGAIAGISGTPTIMGDLSAVPDLEGALFTGASGYVRQSEGRCLTTSYDRDFALIGGTIWGSSPPDAHCRLTQSDVGQLASVSVRSLGTGEVVQVTGIGGGVVMPRPVARTRSNLDDAYAFHDTATATTLVAYRVGDQLVYERHAGGSPQAFRRDGVVTAMSAAVDRLLGGMIVLYRERPVGWRIERLSSTPGEEPVALTSLSGISADPVGPLVTNETEALIPLGDGRMAYIPLARSELRLLEPVDGGAVQDMIVVLRPDSSGGGLLFTQRSSAGQALRFQSLTCNR